MKHDITGKMELSSLKFDWKIYQLNAGTTKCCAGGTRDVTAKHGGRKEHLQAIPNTYDKIDARYLIADFQKK